MDAGTLYGRSISFPPRLGPDGRIAWSIGTDNVRESIKVILLTEPGERVQLPSFGSNLRALLFEPNTVATRRLVQEYIDGALRIWEPRVALRNITVDASPDDATTAIATIEYELVATQTVEQISLTVPLNG
jgi:phage baseplate assembly protein W